MQPAPVSRDGFDVPPDPTELAGARRRLSSWLAAVGAAPALITDLVVAANEALTNAIDHSGTRRPVRVELASAEGAVRITVRDFGRWSHEMSNPDNGRGLLLMDALVEQLEVIRADTGTTVRLVRRLVPRRTPPGSGTVRGATRAGRGGRAAPGPV